MDSDLFKIVPGNTTGFARIQKQWSENSAHLRFEQTYTWYETLLKYIKTKEQTAVIAHHYDKQEENALILPLLFERRWFSTRILPIGNYYTSFFEVIELGENDTQKLQDRYCSLFSNILSSEKWSQLIIEPLDREGQSYCLIIEACRRLKIPYATYYRFDNYTLSLNGKSFSDYYNELPSRLRNTIKRKLKKVQSKFERYEIEIIKKPEDVEKAIDEFEQIYNESWKKQEGIPEFIRDFSLRAAENGWLRLSIMRLNGNPCAAQIWFVKDGIASIFKLAHSEEYRDYSVGTLLFYEKIKELVTVDKISMIDFLIGGDSYKKDWAFKKKERWGVMLFNTKTLFGLLLYIRHDIISGVVASSFLRKLFRSVSRR
ncbi:MAG: GNAT family N-acetyltransferase [Sedimenticola sp.]|nr:GNAT family N-acetyltransferase [Sedimenticola sp.]